MNYLNLAFGMVEECKNEHGKRFELNAVSYNKLLNLCELAKILSDEFSASFVEIKIRPEEINGEITVWVDELVFTNGRSHQFFSFIKEADFLHFNKAETGELQLQFGVYELWRNKQ